MITVAEPSTLYIKFTGEIPKCFIFGNPETGEIFFFRYISGSIPRIKFNVPLPGVYEGNVPFDVVKLTPIQIPVLSLPVLPPATRNRWKGDDIEVQFNPQLETIARNFTDVGIIEVGPRYEALIQPIKYFILLHEQGHFFYDDEFNCDLYALVNFIREGYNVSTAYYTLEKYLMKSQEQMERVRALFSKINSIQPFNSGL